MTMTKEAFEKIFESVEDHPVVGDNVYQGLSIIAKYVDPKVTEIITGVGNYVEGGHILYSVTIAQLIKAGIKRADIITLAKLDWSIDYADKCLKCIL